MSIKFKNIIVATLLPIGLTACLDTGGELDRGSLSDSESSSSVASGAESGATLPVQGEAEEGDLFYNTTDDVLYVNDGTNWVPTGSSGDSNSVVTNTNPAVNLPSANSGDIAYNSTTNELQYYNGSNWVNTSTGATGDDLGDHTSTQNLSLGAFQLVGNGGSSGVSVANNGNVGIGTTNPSALLHTYSTTSGAELLRLRNNTDGADFIVTTNTTTGSQVEISTGNDDIALSTIAGTPDLFIQAGTGNVGIGTAAPSANLEISNNDNSAGVRLSRVDDASDTAEMAFTPGAALTSSNVQWTVGLTNSGTNNFGIQSWDGTTGINHLVVDNTGNVGIGTTSPGFPLEMGSGAHVTVAGVWTDASDKRLKEEISTNYSSALSKVMKLKPVRYYVCADIRDNLDGDCSGEYAEGEPVAHMGFYAQDLLKVFPESVSGTEEDGYGVSYGSLMAPVVASVQELNLRSLDQDSHNLDQDEQILSQGAQIADLKAKNEKLESELAEIKKLLQRLPAAK